MSTVFTRPLKMATMSFLVLMCAFLAFALAGRFGLMQALPVQRAIGALVGLLVVTIGNVLPKLRPLSSPRAGTSGSQRTERFAGRVLVCVGIAHMALFLFAQLDAARIGASIIGVGALAAIAANWIWHARNKRSGGGSMSEDTMPLDLRAVERRKLKIWLFVALFYVLLTSIVSGAFSEQPWAHKLAAAMVIGFGVTCAALFVFLERKRRRE